MEVDKRLVWLVKYLRMGVFIFRNFLQVVILVSCLPGYELPFLTDP